MYPTDCQRRTYVVLGSEIQEKRKMELVSSLCTYREAMSRDVMKCYIMVNVSVSEGTLTGDFILPL